jgi:hypothetical protein
MLIDKREAERAVVGAWRLFLGKPDALRFFDFGADGFWRSFGAILPLAPLYALTALADRRDLIEAAPPDAQFNDIAFWIAKLVTLCFDWATFPITLALIAGFIGIRTAYPAYIVVRNWATLLMIVPFAAIALLDLSGLVSSDLLFLPSLAALAAALRMSYLVARRTLNAGIDFSIGLVVLDFLVSLALVMLIGRLFGFEAI